jgi:hypothetical protein
VVGSEASIFFIVPLRARDGGTARATGADCAASVLFVLEGVGVHGRLPCTA